jgi:hypothetical protein
MANLVSFLLETVLVSVQDRCTICAKCTIGSESFRHTESYFKVTRLMWKLVSVCLKKVLILMQARCTVCA